MADNKYLNHVDVDFETITRPVIEWLNNNSHPHSKIIIDTLSAEMVEGIRAFTTEDYVRD